MPLELFVSYVHPLLLAPRLPFLPLLATSVYCSLGVHLGTLLTLQLWMQYRGGGALDAMAKGHGGGQRGAGAAAAPPAAAPSPKPANFVTPAAFSSR